MRIREDISLVGDFNYFVQSRVEFVCEEPAEKDLEYQNCSKKVYGLLEKIRESLGDNEKLALEYEKAMNELIVCSMEHSYRQGMKDGLQLKQVIGLGA